MASGPLKSQPLHNFSLPHLKWGKNQMNNHRCRKPSSSPPGDDHHHHHHHHRSSYSSSSSSSFASEPESDSGVVAVTSPSYIGSKKKPFGFSSSASPPPQQQQQQTQPLKKQHTTNNLFIRFRKSSSSNKGYESSSKKPHKSGGGGGDESSSAVNKPWNLRPRKTLLKPKPKPFNEIGGGGGEETHSPNKKNPKPTEVEERPAAENYPPPKSLRLRGFAEAAAAHNVVEKKRKFSVSLSRDEIEEDFFVLTGFKPPRRPKKRAKNIQKQLENLFPGLWLTEITAESYSVPEVPLKR